MWCSFVNKVCNYYNKVSCLEKNEKCYNLETTAPYKCEQRQKIIKSVNNYIKRLLPENNAAQHVYKSSNVGSSFNIKDQN